MKRRHCPISVDAENGMPRRIHRPDRVDRVVEVVECWVVESRWWTPGRPERRVYYRVRTPNGLLDLYRTGDAWVLAREAD